MRIYTTWQQYAGSTTLVSAYDENMADEWGGVPDWHTTAVGQALKETVVRDLVIEVPDDAIERLFATPTVEGTVTP